MTSQWTDKRLDRFASNKVGDFIESIRESEIRLDAGIYLPHPYLILPKQFKSVDPLGIYFQALLKEKPQCDFDCKLLGYRAYAIFSYTQSENPAFPFRKPQGLKNLLNAEVKLWKSVLAIAERMNSHDCWTMPPAETLFRIILENQLVMLPCAFSSLNDKDLNVSGYISFYQNQNKTLMLSDSLANNPFSKEKHPTTWNFVRIAMDYAIRTARIKDGFKREIYMPMVRSRQNCTAIMKAGGLSLFTEKGQLKRGRKPE